MILKISLTKIQKYLEKENCSEQSKLIEQYYKDKAIEPFEKEEKIIITEKENCTVDNGKEKKAKKELKKKIKLSHNKKGKIKEKEVLLMMKKIMMMDIKLKI